MKHIKHRGKNSKGEAGVAAHRKSIDTTEGGSTMQKRIGALGCAALLFMLIIGLSACEGTTPTADQGANQETAGATVANTQPKTDDARAAITPDGSDIVIPLSEITSRARFYPTTVDGVALEVLAVKAPDGSVRTAFNTCQVCYDSGRGYYEQEGDVLVCQNCGNRFTMSDVEVKTGGCNPVPIFDENKTVTSDAITIPASYLKETKIIFANWKQDY
jgi:hypothetical protein